jgi:AraC-like DNA-binding protein
MTARAITLTAGATARLATWTLSSADARAFLAAFDRLGFDSAHLQKAAGISESDLADSDARISCVAIGAIVETAQRIRYTPNIGLALARATPIGAYALFDYLVLTSDTVADGVRQLARYTRLVGNPVSTTIGPDEEPVQIDLVNRAAPLSVEYYTGLMVRHLAKEADGHFAVDSIEFEHVPDDAGEFERVLECAVRVGTGRNRVLIPQRSWRLPLRRRDPVLRQVLESHAETQLARTTTARTIVDEARDALARRIARGDMQIDVVARDLGVSSRTLQRRLTEAGASYQMLLDEVRKDAAARYLTESALAICEVAYLIGYSEPAPFHRAFKRWFGTTPDVYRQRRRRGAP